MVAYMRHRYHASDMLSNLKTDVPLPPPEGDAGSFEVSAQLQSDFSHLRERKSVFNVDS